MSQEKSPSDSDSFRNVLRTPPRPRPRPGGAPSSPSSPRTLFRVQASSPLRRHMAIFNRTEVPPPTISRLCDWEAILDRAQPQPSSQSSSRNTSPSPSPPPSPLLAKSKSASTATPTSKSSGRLGGAGETFPGEITSETRSDSGSGTPQATFRRTPDAKSLYHDDTTESLLLEPRTITVNGETYEFIPICETMGSLPDPEKHITEEEGVDSATLTATSTIAITAGPVVATTIPSALEGDYDTKSETAPLYPQNRLNPIAFLTTTKVQDASREVVVIDLDDDDDDDDNDNDNDNDNENENGDIADSYQDEPSDNTDIEVDVPSVLGKRRADLRVDRSDEESVAPTSIKAPRLSAVVVSPAVGSQHCPFELDSDSDIEEEEDALPSPSPAASRSQTLSPSPAASPSPSASPWVSASQQHQPASGSSIWIGSNSQQPINISLDTAAADGEFDSPGEPEDAALVNKIDEAPQSQLSPTPDNMVTGSSGYVDQLKLYQRQQRQRFEQERARNKEVESVISSATAPPKAISMAAVKHDIVSVPSFQGRLSTSVAESHRTLSREPQYVRPPSPVDLRETSSSPPPYIDANDGPSIHMELISKKASDGLELSDGQLYVVDQVVRRRKNIFFTGSAGTGKSVLLRELILRLRARSSRWGDSDDWDSLSAGTVAVTASTGIAACNIGGCTLHSFAGIGLGKDSFEVLSSKVKANKLALSRWRQTQVLIVDEVSMIDAVLLDKLEHLARYLREDGRPWGGIQLVLCGDFFQLPPVDKIGDGKYCFEADSWRRSIHETIQLEQIFRQKDASFASMLNQMRIGRLSSTTISCFRNLDRPIQQDDGPKPTDLFPLRKQVEEANAVMLRRLTGTSMVFQAKDSGLLKDKMEHNCIAPTKLEIKINAQVMLLRNQGGGGGGLVNGSIGTVIEYTTDSAQNFRVGTDGTPLPSLNKPGEFLPRVRFRMDPERGGGWTDLVVGRDEWTLEMPDGEFLGSRVQLPLCLAWALSIHKSQGQTLPRVRVDLGRAFEKGQAYVALSRATSLEGLQVLNFDARKVMVDRKVVDFYAEVERRKKARSRSASNATKIE